MAELRPLNVRRMSEDAIASLAGGGDVHMVNGFCCDLYKPVGPPEQFGLTRRPRYRIRIRGRDGIFTVTSQTAGVHLAADCPSRPTVVPTEEPAPQLASIIPLRRQGS